MTPPQDTGVNDVTLRALAAVCRFAIVGELTDVDASLGQSVQWDAVWDRAEAENLISWCFDFVERHPETITPDRLASWQQIYITTIARNQIALRQLTELVSACREAGITLIALKGAAMLLWLYDDLGSRSLSDIDVLVGEEDALKAVGVLEKLGYAIPPAHERFSNPEVWFHLSRMEGGHFPPFLRGNDFPVELHVGFLRRRGAWLQASEDIRQSTRTANCVGVQVTCLPPEQALLHAAAHYGHHLLDGEAQLSMLLDAAVMNGRGNLLDWDKVWGMARRWNVTYDLRATLVAVNDIFGLDAPIPPNAAISEEPIEGASPLRRLRGMPTLALKLSYVKGSILPPPAYMRDVFRLAPGTWPLLKAYGHIYTLRFRDAVRRVKRGLGG